MPKLIKVKDEDKTISIFKLFHRPPCFVLVVHIEAYILYYLKSLRNLDREQDTSITDDIGYYILSPKLLLEAYRRNMLWG